jgi:hypothetical protein
MIMVLIGAVLLLVVCVSWLLRTGPTRRPEPDDIDHDELEAAEREVRDLGVDQRPEDGWEGDDWGPGAGGGGGRAQGRH